MKFNDEYEIKFHSVVWDRTTEPNERNEPDERTTNRTDSTVRERTVRTERTSTVYCERNRCHQERILRFIFLRWDRKCKTISGSSWRTDLGIKYRRLPCRKTVKLTLLEVLRNNMYCWIGQTIKEETMECVIVNS
jgi:hypothetical protein